MREQDILFRSGAIELAGTMGLPASGGPFPGVLLITGSGQIDRNENGKKYKLNVFDEISRYLAENGIASLRFDKRGVGKSEGDYWTTGFYDRAQDALAALTCLKQQKSIQPENIFLFGHSEGSFIATRLGAAKADVAGIILLSGAAQSGEAVLKWQALQVAKGLKGINGWIIKTFRIDVSKAHQKQLDKIKSSKKDSFRHQFLVKMPAKWLREFMAYDPAEDLPQIDVPVLAITGSKDIQVDPADLERMEQLVTAPFERHLVQDMTHILRSQQGEPSIEKYQEEVKRPIDSRVLEIVLRWIQDRIRLRALLNQ